MAMKTCNCCQKRWDVDLPEVPGTYRKRTKNGLIHEFDVYIPPRKRWKTETRYCLVCNKPHIFFIGPVTGKYHSNVCDT